MFKRSKLALAMGLFMGALVASNLVATPAFADGLPDLIPLIKQNSPAVVNISVESKAGGKAAMRLPDGSNLPPELEKFFRSLPEMQPDGGRGGAAAMGSGFILSNDGYVVTNAHVVDEAKSVTVTLSDKREVPADVIGTDKLSDIALLKIKADNLPVVQLGDSDKLQVGQWVVAIGAPFGLDHSATQGIVSALSRSLPDGTYVPFIQTDVAVNPGNSGGPLFDLNGQVVGVNSQIYSRSGGYMGISFAIPINVAKNVIEQLKANGQVSRGWLGVEIQSLDQKLADSFNMAQPHGALVASVMPDSPADKAHFQAGDIIVDFNGAPVKSAADLPLLVGNTPIGKEVPVKILRAGQDKTLNVTIDKLADKDTTKPNTATPEKGKGALGMLLAPLTELERKDNKVDGNTGIIVREVEPNSAAAQAGLSKGDIILSINNKQISSMDEVQKIVKDAPAGKPLALLITREGRTQFIAVTKP